jgi:S1-C subfamily serine protease
MQANGAASLQDGLACDVGDAQEDVDSARALVARLQAILGADLSAQALDAGCNLHGLGGSAQRGSVGVYLQGTTVVDFVPGSPAAKCGLKKGDRILQVCVCVCVPHAYLL